MVEARNDDDDDYNEEVSASEAPPTTEEESESKEESVIRSLLIEGDFSVAVPTHNGNTTIIVLEGAAEDQTLHEDAVGDIISQYGGLEMLLYEYTTTGRLVMIMLIEANYRGNINSPTGNNIEMIPVNG